MKVSVLQENLSKGLGIVGPATSPRSTLPVLGNVLLATDNGKLKLSATNLEVGISCWIAGNVVEDGGITLPTRTLSDLVNALPKERVDMALTERTQTLNLVSGRTEANIKGIDMQEFPIVPQPGQDDHAITIDADLLSTAIRQVAVAAAEDGSRPILEGVLMKFEGGRLTMAAADGFRLAVRSIPVPRYSGDPFNVIIPARVLTHAARLCKEAEETVDFYLVGTGNSQKVMFQIGTVVLSSQLIPGNFPNYEQIIPATHTTKTQVDTAAFLKACKAALIFARDSAHITRLHAKNGTEPATLKVSATSAETGDNVDELDAVIEGQEIEVAFNVKYLIDMLSNIMTPKLTLETTTAASPGAFRPVGDEDYVHILMPMHIESVRRAPPIKEAKPK